MAAKKKQQPKAVEPEVEAAEVVAEEPAVEADPVEEVVDETAEPIEEPEAPDEPEADVPSEPSVPVEAPVSASDEDAGESEGDLPAGPEFDTGRVVRIEDGEGIPSVWQVEEAVNAGGVKIHPPDVADHPEGAARPAGF